MRTKVHISDLVLIDEAVITGPSISRTSSGKSKLSKAATISTEINLLGKTVDEAVAELDKYLDDAYLSHLPSVRVVHGKGTGALRKGIHNYLRRQKHVADFHLAEFGEGDAGVTIVTFKKKKLRKIWDGTHTVCGSVLSPVKENLLWLPNRKF